MPTKTCTKCKADKDLEAFHIRKSGKYGREPLCKECKKKRYLANRPKRVNQMRIRRLRSLGVLGITVDELCAMTVERQGLCDICGQPDTAIAGDGKIRQLAVDHCYKTKQVRGLLCTNCNVALGAFKDNIETLERAIQYLEAFQTKVKSTQENTNVNCISRNIAVGGDSERNRDADG